MMDRGLVMASALSVSLMLHGCGGGGGGMPSASDGGSDLGSVEPDASLAPTVTVSPTNGQRGVLKNSPIVLAFSEPMDVASVEAAWASSTLPTAELVWSWNAEHTIATIDASAVLEYPAGGPSVDRFGYEIALDATAMSSAGHGLAAPVSSTFETARDVTLTIDTTVAALTGSSDGATPTPATTSVLRVGDSPTNSTWRSFLTFDVSALPAEIVEYTSAALFVRQASITGTPYDAVTGLGAIVVGRIAPPPSLADYASYSAVLAESTTIAGGTGVGDPAGDRTTVVTDALAAAHQMGTDLTLRVEFETAQDGGNDEDAIILASPSIEVHVLAY